MVMFNRGLGGGDEMGVGVWVATAPWPPRCPHPRFKPGAGSSPLPLGGRGDGCCWRGRFGSGEGGGGCGARVAHRVDGAVGVNKSGSPTLTKMIRWAEEYDSAMSCIDENFDAPVGTPEGDELDLLVNQVEVYEAERYPIPPPNPVERSSSASIRGGYGLVPEPGCRENRPGDWGLLDAAQIAPDGAVYGERVVGGGFELGGLCVAACTGGVGWGDVGGMGWRGGRFGRLVGGSRGSEGRHPRF